MHCVSVFLLILRTRKNCFPKQHNPFGLSNNGWALLCEVQTELLYTLWNFCLQRGYIKVFLEQVKIHDHLLNLLKYLCT